MNAEPISRKEFLVTFATAFSRSRFGRVLLALAVVAISLGLAYMCWQARGVIVGLLAIVLVIFGFRVALELLPFSEETRSLWARERELSERYPSYRWRNVLWFGLGMLALRLWDSYVRQSLNPWELVPSGIFIVIGAVATIIWRTRHCNERDA